MTQLRPELASILRGARIIQAERAASFEELLRRHPDLQHSQERLVQSCLDLFAHGVVCEMAKQKGDFLRVDSDYNFGALVARAKAVVLTVDELERLLAQAYDRGRLTPVGVPRGGVSGDLQIAVDLALERASRS